MGYTLEGLGLARPSVAHQRIARNIVINWYNMQGFEKIEAFQEGTANFKTTGEDVPDVIFVDVSTQKVVVSIEIEKHFRSKLKRKVADLLDTFKHKEVFVYDYIRELWYRCTWDKKNKEMIVEKGVSKSKELSVDFKDYLELE
ncbi:MAG: hypothetical protein OHK0038_28900 [Flammeovirgaceae bacterium]